MIPIVLFGVLVAVLAALVLYSLHELDNPLVVPQVVAAILATVLAFTLAAMITNGLVIDITPVLSTTQSNTTTTDETNDVTKFAPATHKRVISNTSSIGSTLYRYTVQRIAWVDPSVSLILALVGVCESLLVVLVGVSTVIRIFSDGDGS